VYLSTIVIGDVAKPRSANGSLGVEPEIRDHLPGTPRCGRCLHSLRANARVLYRAAVCMNVDDTSPVEPRSSLFRIPEYGIY
jgi:hypothetical protein